MKKNNIWKFLFKQKLLLFIWILLSIFHVLFSIVFAIVFQHLIDAVTLGSYDKFMIYIISTVLTILGLSLSNYFAKKIFYIYEKYILIDIKGCIFSSILNKSASSFAMYEESDYINFLTQSIVEIKQNFFDSLFYMTYDIFMFSIGILAVFFMNVKMGLVILIMAFLNLVVPLLMKKSIRIKTNENLFRNIEMIGYLKNILHGFHTIRLYGITNKMNKKYSKLNQCQENTNYVLNKLISYSNSIIYFFNYMTVSIPWFIGAYFVMKGEFSIGVLMGISQLNNNVASPLSDFFTRFNSFVSGKYLCDKILAIIEEDKKEEDLFLDEIHSLSLSNMMFSIDHQLILHDLTFHFQAQKKYLIIGKSGSGKSTILKLIAKYFDYDQGMIKINHIDLKDIHSISNKIHMISQDTYLFEDTVMNNLTLYHSIDQSKVIKILNKVGLSNLIPRLYDTVNNDELSGGEKQRISIARALLHPAPILLIDEACSSLDAMTGIEIESLILQLKNQMIIEVAHKIYKELLSSYDEIIWLKEGRIYAFGSYDQMIKLNEFCEYIDR